MRRPGVAQRAIASGGQRSPLTISSRTDGSAWVIIASEVGTVENTVTLPPATSSARSSPKRAAPRSGTTSAAPFENAIHISSTEPSKPSENP